MNARKLQDAQKKGETPVRVEPAQQLVETVTDRGLEQTVTIIRDASLVVALSKKQVGRLKSCVDHKYERQHHPVARMDRHGHVWP